MITEDNFVDKVVEATGKELGKDWGLMAGTQFPFDSRKGMQSSVMVDGYVVWKRSIENSESKYTEIKLKSEGIEKNLENIINFLTS
jgi:hypothetical protein